MNLYKLYRIDSIGYDEYDSCVVVAETEEAARHIHPSQYAEKEWWLGDRAVRDYWSKPNELVCELIGTTETLVAGTIVCASFNAG